MDPKQVSLQTRALSQYSSMMLENVENRKNLCKKVMACIESKYTLDILLLTRLDMYLELRRRLSTLPSLLYFEPEPESDKVLQNFSDRNFAVFINCVLSLLDRYRLGSLSESDGSILLVNDKRIREGSTPLAPMIDKPLSLSGDNRSHHHVSRLSIVNPGI